MRAARLVSKKDFLSRLDDGSAETKKLDIWSVGCATGEEPYSLAIFVEDYLQKNKIAAYYSVTATDISRASLVTAREGIYHRNRLKNLPVRMLRKYFLPHDLEARMLKMELSYKGVSNENDIARTEFEVVTRGGFVGWSSACDYS